jgi:hypothetical protein
MRFQEGYKTRMDIGWNGDFWVGDGVFKKVK